jgi:hypothetical protein
MNGSAMKAFTILAVLWLAFVIALDASRSSLDAAWRGVGALPLPVKGVFGRIMRGRQRKHLEAIQERLEGGAQTNGVAQQ